MLESLNTWIMMGGSAHPVVQYADMMKDHAERVVERCFERGWLILVGDNPKGVDKWVIDKCIEMNTAFSIYSVGGIRRYPPLKQSPPNYKFLEYHDRDCNMINLADMCYFIWDGQSKGTRMAAEYAMKLKDKEMHVFNASKGKVTTFEAGRR